MKPLSAAGAECFIRRNTALTAPPHVQEIVLHPADEAHDLWQRTKDELSELGPPPLLGLCLAPGQSLARWKTPKSSAPRSGNFPDRS